MASAIQNAGTNIEGISQMPILRQFGFMVGLAATIAAAVAVVMWAQQPNFSLLYSGLTEKDSAGVIDALDKAHVPYQLGGQGTVMVPTDKIHDMRIKLAAQGLPKGSAVGFESLNDSQGFGVSQFMETARYQRSLEVELSRSISTLTNVESARVHLAIPKRSVFLRDKQKPSASVILNLSAGRSLEEEQVSAIMHLVSSGIPDLDTSQVTIVDQRGRLLTSKQPGGDFAASAAQFEYTQKLEKSYAQRIEDLLAPIVGKEAVRAQVSTELDFTSNETTEETFNPETPVVRSEQIVQERMTNGTESGVPGALSNQPPGAAKAPEKAPAATAKDAKAAATAKASATNDQAQAAAVNSKQRTVKNYELDRTISHTRMGPGVIKRITVAVVLDDKVTPGDGGALIRTPHSPEDIERFTALVKEAVGYSQKRGDSVRVIGASFSVPPPVEALPEVALWKRPDFWDKAKQGFGALLVLILVIGVLRILGKIATGFRDHRAALQVQVEQSAATEQINLAQQQAAQLNSPAAVNMTHVKDMAKQDPKLVAQVVKGWVAADG
ncbi:MAG: flagellar M-ring protein FliF [Gammaproteobacteria bacterium]|nr:flagellar M-ring protein FliF [Gammaproteobacteria bacterium]